MDTAGRMRSKRPFALAQNSVTVLDDARFARLMARLELPDVRRGGLAVAVSGGADSMALACLVADWCARRAVVVTALGVDHALRENSAKEAAQSARWLAARGIAHVTLRWRGVKPRTAIQEAARAARYALLTGWCRDNGVALLLLAHHEDDQAETVLMRLARGGDIEAMAAMRPTLVRDGIVLARPLLGISSACLRATLRARGQPWIEDPSNQDQRYERVRVRRVLASPGGGALKDVALGVSRKAGVLRALTDALVYSWLARHVRFFEAGYGEIELTALCAAHRALARRVLARVLTRVGGRNYAARRDGLDGALDALVPVVEKGKRFAGRTLAGCHLLIQVSETERGRSDTMAQEADRGTLLVVRENRGASALPLMPGRHTFDHRFEVDVQADAPVGRYLDTLGEAGWRELAARAPGLKSHPIPLVARTSLPAVKDDLGVVAVPHLGYRRDWGLACLPVLRHVAGKVTRLAHEVSG